MQARGELESTNGETIHLHGTDGEGEWLLTLGPDAFTMTHEHAKGDVALRGSVSDLALLLYGRPTIGAVEHLGDDAAFQCWQRAWPWT
jgi:hypothetical protein